MAEEDTIMIGLRQGNLQYVSGQGKITWDDKGIFLIEEKGGKVFVPYHNLAYLMDGSEVAE